MGNRKSLCIWKSFFHGINKWKICIKWNADLWNLVAYGLLLVVFILVVVEQSRRVDRRRVVRRGDGGGHVVRLLRHGQVHRMLEITLMRNEFIYTKYLLKHILTFKNHLLSMIHRMGKVALSDWFKMWYFLYIFLNLAINNFEKLTMAFSRFGIAYVRKTIL